MDGLRGTLEAELKGLQAYTVTPKRIDTTKLIEEIPGLLAPDVFSKLPDIARYDLNEAGVCIAFDRPTAAAFHLMRATESVLRAFYHALVKRNRVREMWGPIIKDLRGRRKARPYEVLLNHLDHIRHSFRNPTQHPDAIYDIHEVQDLWELCIDAINRMSKALED